jgi:hypothetical protein
VAQHGNQDGVLEHIGMVAGVKGVTIAEHGKWMLTTGRPATGTPAFHARIDRYG